MRATSCSTEDGTDIVPVSFIWKSLFRLQASLWVCSGLDARTLLGQSLLQHVKRSVVSADLSPYTAQQTPTCILRETWGSVDQKKIFPIG